MRNKTHEKDILVRHTLVILFFFVNCIPVSAQWSKINSLTANTIRDMEYNNGSLYVAASNGLWKSTDHGISWTNISTGLSGDALQTYDIFFDGGALYIATVEGNYKTTNGGANWIGKSSGIQIGPGASKRYCYTYLRDGATLYSGAFSGLYRSSDGGDSWTLAGLPGPHSNVISMTIHNSQVFAGRTSVSNTLMKSTDNGSTWIPTPFFSGFSPEVFCFHETPDNKLFIGTGHGVYFTTNNGANWTQRNNGLSSDPYISSIVQRGNTLIGSGKFGARGIFITTNEGISWDTAGTQAGLPVLSDMYKLLIVNDTLYLAASNGVYKRNLSEIITGVTQTSSLIPESFSLYQNYPNPFNPSTTIRFDLPVKDLVSLKIYDITGREIKSLLNGSLSPGIYSVLFDASDLSSGVYFYMLRTSSFTKTMKMTLLK